MDLSEPLLLTERVDLNDEPEERRTWRWWVYDLAIFALVILIFA